MSILNVGQVVTSIALIALILIQERSSGLSGIFGYGGGGGTPYQTRRGLEKAIYWATIATAILFAALALANLVITS